MRPSLICLEHGRPPAPLHGSAEFPGAAFPKRPHESCRPLSPGIPPWKRRPLRFTRFMACFMACFMAMIAQITAPAIVRASAAPFPGGRHEGSAVPPDFKVVAQYAAGESDWKSWTVTLGSQGRGTQSVYGEKPRPLTLTAAQMRSLIACVREQRFWRLRREYPTEALDGPTLLLTVTSHGRTHRVVVLLPSPVPQGGDIGRFLRVWSEVLRLVPSPNPDQTPTAYITPTAYTFWPDATCHVALQGRVAVPFRCRR